MDTVYQCAVSATVNNLITGALNSNLFYYSFLKKEAGEMNFAMVDNKRRTMQKGDRFVFEAVDLSLVCISGILWITWPGSDDIILTEKQMIRVETGGKVCIMSFAESSIEILSIKKIKLFKLRFRKLYKKEFSCVKNIEGTIINHSA